MKNSTGRRWDLNLGPRRSHGHWCKRVKALLAATRQQWINKLDFSLNFLAWIDWANGNCYVIFQVSRLTSAGNSGGGTYRINKLQTQVKDLQTQLHHSEQTRTSLEDMVQRIRTATTSVGLVFFYPLHSNLCTTQYKLQDEPQFWKWISDILWHFPISHCNLSPSIAKKIYGLWENFYIFHYFIVFFYNFLYIAVVRVLVVMILR